MKAALMGGIFICAVRQTARNTKLADGNPVGYAPCHEQSRHIFDQFIQPHWATVPVRARKPALPAPSGRLVFSCLLGAFR